MTKEILTLQEVRTLKQLQALKVLNAEFNNTQIRIAHDELYNALIRSIGQRVVTSESFCPSLKNCPRDYT